MPVNQPPFGGAGRRRRNRLSGSSLVSWERCPRSWMVKRRIGLRGPVRPSMILGILLEEAVVGMLMESPPYDGTCPPGVASLLKHMGADDTKGIETEKIDSLKGVEKWLISLIPAVAKNVYNDFLIKWKNTPWKMDGKGPDDIQIKTIEKQIQAGVKMQISEASKCLDEGGGPHLEKFRKKGDPFKPVAPRWQSPPNETSNVGFLDFGDPVSWWEAWEISRPWMKDPRISSAQRIHHPEGWASGEMDLVHRWRKYATIVDIKSGFGKGKTQTNLETQINFYRWLWHQTRSSNEQKVDKLAGWFLLDGYIHEISAQPDSKMSIEKKRLLQIRNQMKRVKEQDWTWLSPEGTNEEHPLYCAHCEGLEICGYSSDPEDRSIQQFLPAIEFTISDNVLPIKDIPSRLSVRGSIDNNWQEIENSYGELVRVSSLRAGNTKVTIEETEEGVVEPEKWTGDIGIINTNPGIFRGTPHIFLDSRSEMIDYKANENWTRLGLIPTKASVSGQVVSMSNNQGISTNGRPWTIRTIHLWDGTGVIEVAAFGSNRSRTFESLKIGDQLIVHHGELGWREGNPQIQINKQTSIELIKSDS